LHDGSSCAQLLTVGINPMTQARPRADQCLVNDLYGRPLCPVEPGHQQARARAGELIDNLAQRRLVGDRRAGACVFLAFSGVTSRRKSLRAAC
jgi:hypothetical protein